MSEGQEEGTLHDCDTCGHPRKSHRYGGANTHGKYTFLSSCKKHDCECDQYRHPGVIEQ